MSYNNSKRSKKRALQVQKQKEKRSQSSNNVSANLTNIITSSANSNVVYKNRPQIISRKQYLEHPNPEDDICNSSNEEFDSERDSEIKRANKRRSNSVQQPTQFILSKHSIYTPVIDNDAEQVVSDLDGEVEDINDDVNSHSMDSNNLAQLKPKGAPMLNPKGGGSFLPMKNSLQAKKFMNSENVTPSYLLLMETLNEEKENKNSKNVKGEKTTRRLSHDEHINNNKPEKNSSDLNGKIHLRLPSVINFLI